MHCLLYFPSLPDVLFFIFICFFYFSTPEPEKRAGILNDKDVDSQRVFREGLFERGKVIFAPHDTLNGFLLFY